jgi:2,3-bisphosphoglycerate-dependent phosphoglycerate mutase
MILYLIRHAQSANNAKIDIRTERDPDPALTALGQRQAVALASYLATAPEPDQLSDMLAWRYGVFDGLRYRVDRVVTSPMQRALQTAQPLADTLAIPVMVWPTLCEIGGLYHFRGGRGDRETRHAAHERALTVAATLRARLAEDWEDERVLLVAHAGFLNLLLQALLGALNVDAEATEGFVAYFYNTSITRLDLSEDGHTALRYVNRIPHLTDEMVS